MELSSYFVEERGKKPFYFEQEAAERGRPAFSARTSPARQQRRPFRVQPVASPVREQSEVVGHAVRAMYLYCAMADLAGEYGDADAARGLRAAVDALTTQAECMSPAASARRRSNEGFTHDYDLPNESAYAETCAAIGLVFWAQRMLAFDLDARYADMLERRCTTA